MGWRGCIGTPRSCCSASRARRAASTAWAGCGPGCWSASTAPTSRRCSARSNGPTTRARPSIPVLLSPRPIGDRSPISRSGRRPRRSPKTSRSGCVRWSGPRAGRSPSSTSRPLAPSPEPLTLYGNLSSPPRHAHRPPGVPRAHAPAGAVAGRRYSQLSQRYVDESQAAFVMPPAILGDATLEAEWQAEVADAQAAYVRAVEALMQRYEWGGDKVHRRKMAREAARSVLPNATEVKIVVSGNARAWRTMLELRTGEGAELEIRRMAVACLRVLQREAPALFSDFEIYVADDRQDAARVAYHKV